VKEEILRAMCCRGKRTAAALRKKPRRGEYWRRREVERRRCRVSVAWSGRGEHGEKRQRKKKERG
jgi:hypothetical protein